jgi:hypothetical protein
LILNRSEMAPVKASAVIGQVDVNTLKVVATSPSQMEGERQTGIPRTNIRRGLRQSRSLKRLSAFRTVAMLLNHEAENLFLAFIYLLCHQGITHVRGLQCSESLKRNRDATPWPFVKAHAASALYDSPQCTDMLKREKYPNTGQCELDCLIRSCTRLLLQPSVAMIPSTSTQHISLYFSPRCCEQTVILSCISKVKGV